jgi:energy-coupling factor transporter ATP-binding protein EcfA2
MVSIYDINNNIVINNKNLPPFDIKIEKLLNKSIILYGSRGSGKSVLCRDLMYILKDSIPVAVIFNTTEKSNNCFSSMVPKPFLYDKVDLDMLNVIWKRQENITEIYKKVNDEKVLISILKKLNLTKALDVFDKINQEQDNIANNLQEKIKSDNEFYNEFNKLKNKFNKLKMTILKEFIVSIRKKIKKNEVNKTLLNNEDIDIIKYINVNPNLLVVFDDCAAELKKYTKSDTLRKFFYQSRHVNLTFIITAQDEIDLDASLRKNVNVTILCDANCCNGFFERSSNSFGKRMRQYTREISDFIFTNNMSKNIKLVYDKDNSNNQVMWHMANIKGDFLFGSKTVMSYANEMLEQKENDISIIVKKI